MADEGAEAPGAARALYLPRAADLLDALRARLLRLTGEASFSLPAPPALPPPAGDEDELCARGAALQRPLAPVEAACGNSFLRAAARELCFDADAYCAAQRAAVVGALELCAPATVLDALARVSWASRGRDAWKNSMRLRTTPFDALALMLWSLLNAKVVLVLGGDEEHDEEFCAAIDDLEEVYDTLMVGLTRGDDRSAASFDMHVFVGFDRFERQLYQVPQAPHAGAGRHLDILSFGSLSAAALSDEVAAGKAWIGKPKFEQRGQATERQWCGKLFIIGDGFKSTNVFHSSVDPRTKCLYTSTVSASESGRPVFTVTESDRPDEPLSGMFVGGPWGQVYQRVKQAIAALPPGSVQPLGMSNLNGKKWFGFVSEDYLQTHEDVLDPEQRFTQYWEFKARVTAGQPPEAPFTARRRTHAAAVGAGGAGDGEAAATAEDVPVARHGSRRRRISMTAAANGAAAADAQAQPAAADAAVPPDAAAAAAGAAAMDMDAPAAGATRAGIQHDFIDLTMDD
jgi:hypothetical protein